MKRGYNPGTHRAECRCFACAKPTTSWNSGLKMPRQIDTSKRIAARKALREDPERYAQFIERCRASGIRSARKKATRAASCPEHYIRGYLDALGIDYVYQYVVEGVCLADFYLPSHNLILEYDGSFWHKRAAAQDARRTEALKARDYRVLRVTEMTLAQSLREEFARQEAF